MRLATVERPRQDREREPGGKSVNKQLARSVCRDLCSICSSVHMGPFVLCMVRHSSCSMA